MAQIYPIPLAANPNFSGTTADGSYATGNPTYVDPTVKTAAQTGQAAYTKPTSSTVVSNATIHEDVIPKDNNRLANISNKGATAGADGIVRNADGSLLPTPNGAYRGQDGNYYLNGTNYGNPDNGASPTDPNGKVISTDDSDPTNEIVNQLRQSLDAETKMLIDSYERTYAAKRKVQQDINERANKGREQSLLLTGSSRYAPLSATGIQHAQEVFGLQEIDRLDAEENNLIAQAKIAQGKGEREILNKLLDQAENKRKEKQAQAQKLIEKQADELKTIRTEEAKKQAEVLKNINEVLTDARKNNAPANVINAIANAETVEDAVNAAGDYSATGSGQLGEYYTYKREALSAGQNPMSWQEYKNWDDNNKAAIQAQLDALGLNKEQRSRIAALQDDYDKQIKDIKTVVTQSQNIDALGKNALSTNPDSGSRAASQIGVIFSFMKMLDPSSTVREGEYATAQNTAGVQDQIRNLYNKALDGSFLTDTQIKGYIKTAGDLAEVRRRNREEIDTEFDRRAAIWGIPKGTITKTITTDSIIDSEKNAKASLDSFLIKNPEKKSEITTRVKTMETSLGRPITSAEFLEAYPEYK